MENQQANPMNPKDMKSERQLNNNITVVDLDGCLSDDRWRANRIPVAAQSQADWNAYHEVCDQDPPSEVGAAVLREHIKEGDFIIFATGRPFDVAEKTAKWITSNFHIKPFADFTIVMRRPEDTRTQVELKSEFVTFIARHAMETKKQVRVAYDNRPDVVEMYVNSGISAMVMDFDGVRAYDAPLDAEIAEDLAKVDQIFRDDRRKAVVESLAKEVHNVLQDNPSQAAQMQASRGDDRKDYQDVTKLLHILADTFEAKNQVYGNSGIKVGAVMAVLFPDGITIHTAQDFRMMAHFERIVAKMVRFVNSGLTHADSIEDLAVYAAMCAAETERH